MILDLRSGQRDPSLNAVAGSAHACRCARTGRLRFTGRPTGSVFCDLGDATQAQSPSSNRTPALLLAAPRDHSGAGETTRSTSLARSPAHIGIESWVGTTLTRVRSSNRGWAGNEPIPFVMGLTCNGNTSLLTYGCHQVSQSTVVNVRIRSDAQFLGGWQEPGPACFGRWYGPTRERNGSETDIRRSPIGITSRMAYRSTDWRGVVESSSRSWDLVVVGGGSAGIVAAQTAVSLGASVLLIEKHRMGGDCLWTGCVPSKSLIAAASIASNARHGTALGINVSDVSVDFPAVMQHIHSAIRTIEPVDSAETLEKSGVKVLVGTGHFMGPGLLEVDGRPLKFRQALLAMGAAPTVPGIPGLSDTHYLTSDSIWDLTELPRRLVVLGAGSIGCELGQAFARLGSDVTLVDGADRILPREDPEAASAVARSLEHDGVEVLTGRDAETILPNATGHVGSSEANGHGAFPNVNGHGGEIIIGHGLEETRVEFDQLLVAVGRLPRTKDLGLDNVGVELDGRGFVRVSPSMRTTNNRIWAAGDLTDHPQFTHTAGVNGSLAASNAVLGLRRKADSAAVPRVTFTDPEIAAVGHSTAATSTAEFSVLSHEHDAVDRAIAEQDTGGFTRLAIDRKGRILGGTIVGPRAGESVSELTLAVRLGLRTKDIANTIHPYPTFSDGIWMAAIEDVRRRLQQPTTAKITGLMGRLRRATLPRPKTTLHRPRATLHRPSSRFPRPSR